MEWQNGLLEPHLQALVGMSMVVIMSMGVGQVQGVGGLVFDVVVDLTKRGAALGGGLAAVFIFGGDAGLSPGEGGDLDPNPAALGVDRLATPGEGIPLHFLAAHPEGGTFVEEEMLERISMLGLGEDLEQDPGAALFHLGRNDGNVQRPGFHQVAREVADQFR